jgi:putative phosphoesterase
MPTRVAIISDTHIPSRARDIPDWVLEELDRAEYAIHAGDFDAYDSYDHVQSVTPDLTAVLGNIDPQDMDLPLVDTLDVEGVRFVVTHGSGDLGGYEARVGGIVADHADPDRTTIGIAGHTHQLTEWEAEGYHCRNPGTCTAASPATFATMLVATVEGDTVEFEGMRRKR